MSYFSRIDFGRRARQLRVDTLIRLRWLAVAGQSIAILVVHFGLGFPVPLGLAFAAIAASVWLNIGLRLRYGVNHRLDDDPATILLAYDLLQLSALLYLTGGLQNPFAMLFLAPIMISAVSLSVQRTLALVALVVLAATLLAFFYLPLPWAGGELSFPLLYRAGVWLALVCGAIFVAAYAFRVAEEARRLSDALTATELVLTREQHLTQLDGLAAAAAHELGTPLATITLVARELKKASGDTGPYAEDIALLVQEAQRCRSILGKLASMGAEEAADWQSMSLRHLLEEVAEPYRHFGVDLSIDATGEGPEPRCVRNPGIIYGLGNLIENAVDFAASGVRIEARWTPGAVRVEIADDGPGFSPEVLAKLGEPYVTTRAMERRARNEEGGLGLGLFIAKTLLERSGAIVSMSNSEWPAIGARIVIAWPRTAFDARDVAGGDVSQSRVEIEDVRSKLSANVTSVRET
ncbi:MAG: ActS/PrrB/RegB family redox-sensitive histidine kinase [Beijerinckiaceae bacterium]